MIRYETPMPRTSFGLAAIALSAITFALTVILPAQLYSGRAGDTSSASAKSAAPEVIEVSIVPSRIDVTGQCEQSMAYDAARRTHTVVDRQAERSGVNRT